MAKLVYVGFPSPLTKVACFNTETSEEVKVSQVSRGICQDISAIPEKKGKYKLELEFEFDPSVLNNLSNLSMSGTEQTGVSYQLMSRHISSSVRTREEGAAKDINSFDLNIPGMLVKPNDDGTISFRLENEDGTTTEVNAEMPGMKVSKNEDGTVHFSVPQETNTSSTVTSSSETHPGYSTKTTRTTTTMSSTMASASASVAGKTEQIIPGKTEQIVAGTLTIPRQQNIKIKLPCPQKHQASITGKCTAPDGTEVAVQYAPVDDGMINVEFSPSAGNGMYSLMLMIGESTFPGCPINMEVKGL